VHLPKSFSENGGDKFIVPCQKSVKNDQPEKRPVFRQLGFLLRVKAI